jgi:N-acetyl sugar amidotransferase
MPDTKPDLQLDEEGICNACRSYEKRKEVDWEARREELKDVLAKYRSKDGSNWDCIIPVSGGKDSTYQVIRMLQLGMNPLCVTATTCDLSDIGRKNIENIKAMGVDYIEFTTNPIVRRKLNRIGLTQVGDISWPEHCGIFTIPVRAAVQFGVPLIVWGENSQNEYGGPGAAAENNVLNRRWLEEFGGLLGFRVTDIVGMEGIEEKNLIPYTYPTDDELQRVGVTGIFMGYYLPWDGYSNALIAQAHGFATLQTTVEGSVVNYENLDNHQTGIHDYFKFLKFGFGRATDITCLHVRRGRITRQDAIGMVNRHDGKFPWTYLGKPLAEIIEPIGINVDEFIKICDRFTNKQLFKTDHKGSLIKDERGNLIRKFPVI